MTQNLFKLCHLKLKQKFLPEINNFEYFSLQTLNFPKNPKITCFCCFLWLLIWLIKCCSFKGCFTKFINYFKYIWKTFTSTVFKQPSNRKIMSNRVENSWTELSGVCIAVIICVCQIDVWSFSSPAHSESIPPSNKKYPSPKTHIFAKTCVEWRRSIKINWFPLVSSFSTVDHVCITYLRSHRQKRCCRIIDKWNAMGQKWRRCGEIQLISLCTCKAFWTAAIVVGHSVDANSPVLAGWWPALVPIRLTLDSCVTVDTVAWISTEKTRERFKKNYSECSNFKRAEF